MEDIPPLGDPNQASGALIAHLSNLARTDTVGHQWSRTPLGAAG
jgi:hypothetical protein